MSRNISDLVPSLLAINNFVLFQDFLRYCGFKKDQKGKKKKSLAKRKKKGDKNKKVKKKKQSF